VSGDDAGSSSGRQQVLSTGSTQQQQQQQQQQFGLLYVGWLQQVLAWLLCSFRKRATV
jgi:hypothetical protein